MDRLAGKVAVITGASSGIGRASAALFASDDSRWVTGQVLPVDGGASAC